MISDGNPWKLSKREQVTIEAVCLHGNRERAADAIFRSPDTVNSSLRDIRWKMRVTDTVRAAVLWTEWKWSQKLEQAQKADDIGLSSLSGNSSKDKQTS